MSKKLWSKGYELDAEIERFTVGEDHVLDRDLVEVDCLGSMAHACMLAKIGILTEEELAALKSALAETAELGRQGKVDITLADEDVHTAIENRLIETLGDLGKKIHTGRSRNDQVILDMRLFSRERIVELARAVAATAEQLADFAEWYKDVPMVGRTHTQRAMPSSVGLWTAAFAESLSDDLRMLAAAYELVDQCPLGSAASYGVALPLDREWVAELLGFSRVQTNVLYVNNSRGKMEGIVLAVCVEIMLDLAKLSADLIWFSTPEFGYFTLPEKYCPGSSIMPQKKNPGPLELVRASSARVQAALYEVQGIIRALPSGYNRDLQITKGPFMRGLATTRVSAEVTRRIFEELVVNEQRLIDSFSPEVYAADRALDLAAQGVPFREAYRRLAAELEPLADEDPRENIRRKLHTGAPGNLRLDLVRESLKRHRAFFDEKDLVWCRAREALLAP